MTICNDIAQKGERDTTILRAISAFNDYYQTIKTNDRLASSLHTMGKHSSVSKSRWIPVAITSISRRKCKKKRRRKAVVNSEIKHNHPHSIPHT